jgi:hypothetical protein
MVLVHLEQHLLEEQVVHLDNEMTMDPTNDELEEWNALNDRQKEMAEHTAETAMQFGMFKQDSSADGAHYFDGSKNPFKSEGVMCKNCIFFNEDANQCIVVEGNIDEEGLCKLWVIPEDELTESNQQETLEESPVMKSMWAGSFDPRNISK